MTGDDAKNNPPELAEALRNAERRVAMTRVASALAHAIGTPLNVIAGRAAIIGSLPKNGGKDGAAAANAAVIERQVTELVEKIQRALDYLRGGPSPPEVCTFEELLGAARSTYGELARARDVSLDIVPPEATSLNVQRRVVLQVLADFISLGLGVVKAGGRITLAARREHAEPPALERGRAAAGTIARFLVTYSGVSLPAQLISVPHEPWTAPVPGGDPDLSLLLTVCFGLARENLGWIDVQRTDQDSSLILSLPFSGG
jgi:two-component system, NtrC family, sensor kinase